MSFRHLDAYAAVPSPITTAPPVARVLGTASIAIAAALLPLDAWIQLAVLGMLVAAAALLARVPPRMLLARIAGPLGFVLLASAGLLLLVPGPAAFHVGPVAVSRTGLDRFAFLLGRAVVALGATVVLVTTTRFPDLLHALRQLRLPAVVTTALGLAYRLLYLLVDELERVQRAARSRNAGEGSASRRRLLIGVTAALLARAFARGERTHRAMLARGFDGDLRPLHAPTWDRRGALVLGLLLVTVAAITASAHLIR